jgi:hypothetical protein
MSSVLLEPAILAVEGVQTYASDRTAIGIGFYLYGLYILDRIFYRCLYSRPVQTLFVLWMKGVYLRIFVARLSI